MAAASPHPPNGDAGPRGATLTGPSQGRTTSTDHAGTSLSAAELAAGCALSHGFALLHYQLTGLPTTLRTVLANAARGKVPRILSPATAAHVMVVTQKLSRVPSLLAEWERTPSVPTAQLLCAQARQLFADVPFTRPFLRTQSRAFHEAVAAGTTELPAAVCRVTQQAIGAAEEHIRVSCHRLVEMHLYLAHLIAQEYRAVGISAEDVRDLIQDGCLGLLAAADRFDVRAGASFRTYATYWLRQAMTRSLRLRRIVLPPRAQQRLARQLRRKATQLEQLFTHAISPEELATATGLSPREIAAALATQRREISLDTPLGDGRTWADVLAAPELSPDDNEEPSTDESAYLARLRRGGPG